MGGQTRDCGRRCGIFVRAVSEWLPRHGGADTAGRGENRPVTRSLPSPV
ncbi:hypothetical protein [Azospirillum palustre]